MLHQKGRVILLASFVVFSLCCRHPAHAQEPFVSFDFTLGALYPAESAGGFYFGAALHKPFAQGGAWKWELDVNGGVTRRNYRELAAVASDSVAATPNLVPAAEIDFSRTLVPVAAGFTLKLSFAELNLPNFPVIGWLSRASVIGVSGLKDAGLLLRPKAMYTFLWSEENFSGSGDERRYEGWGWGGEIGMYLSTDNDVASTLSVLYQNTTVDRKKGRDLPLLPAAQEVKLNGLGFLFSLGLGF